VRALFWRRKNARLATRLNTLVETSERVRKTRARKAPRVVIDTSYLEQADADANWEAEQADLAQHSWPQDVDQQTYVDDQQGVEPAVAPASVVGQTVPDSEMYEEDDDETSAILREAIEQLDRAETREAEALEREASTRQEADAQLELIEQLRAEKAEQEQARGEIEQELSEFRSGAAAISESDKPSNEDALNEDSARHEAEEQRAVIEQLTADLLRTQKKHAHAAADRDVATSRAVAAELKLSDMRELEASVAAAMERAAAAETRAAAASQDSIGERTRIASLEAASAEEQSARIEAERAQKVAAQEVATLEKQLAAFDQATGVLNTEQQRASDAEASLRELATKSEQQCATITCLETDLVELKAAHQVASAANAFAVNQSAAADRELADLRQMVELSSESLSKLEAKEAAARKELNAERAVAKRHETKLATELETAQTALAAAEAETAGIVSRRTATERELAELREAANNSDATRHQADEAEARASETLAELKTQRAIADQLESEAEKLRQELSVAQKNNDAAATRAAETEAALGALQLAAKQASTTDRGNAEAQQACVDEMTHERDELRQQLVSLEAVVDDAIAASRSSEQELAELRDSAAKSKEVESLYAEVLRREAKARSQTEATEQHIADLKSDLEKERSLRAGVEAQLDVAIQVANESEALSSTSPLDDQIAAQPDVSQTPDAPQMPASNAESTAEQVAATSKEPRAKSEEASDKAETSNPNNANDTATPTAATKLKPARAKRGKRITAKATPATPATGSASRVDNLIQSRIGKATAKKESGNENRRAKRVSSRKLASLWQEGMSAPLSCTMLDRSSTGAKLEVLSDRYNNRMNELYVGDRFTVTQTYAQERTSVACEIMWVDGQRCGVRFCGQIRTEIVKQPKRTKSKEPEKSTTSKSIKSLFGAGAK
jgi:hypothetical protein